MFIPSFFPIRSLFLSFSHPPSKYGNFLHECKYKEKISNYQMQKTGTNKQKFSSQNEVVGKTQPTSKLQVHVQQNA